MSTTWTSLALASALALVACRPEPPSVEQHLARVRVDPNAASKGADGEIAGDDRLVAEFAGGRLTVADVRRWTDDWTEYDRIRYQSPDRKKELVQQIVALELLAREALKDGYDRRPDVVTLLKREVARRYLDDRVAGQVTLKDIPDAEVATFYEGHRADYVSPETRRVRHVRVGRESLARQVRAELDASFAAVGQGAALSEWERLGETYNEDRDTRALGGDLGWIDAEGRIRGSVRDARVCATLATAAFGVEGGWGLAGPVECDGHWEIGLVVEVRPARQQPLDEVTSRIRNRLLQQRREAAKRALIDQLRGEAGVTVDEAALEALKPVRYGVPRLPVRVIDPNTPPPEGAHDKDVP